MGQVWDNFLCGATLKFSLFLYTELMLRNLLGIISLFVLTSCTTTDYENLFDSYFEKTEYKAVAINPFSHILSNDSWSSTRWNIKTNAVGYRYYSHSTLAARRGALDKCYASGETYCVLAWVNNNYVAVNEVAMFRQKNPQLVQQAIFTYNQQAQMNSQSINSAIGQAGQDLTEISRGGIKTVDPTTNGETQICNFKAFSGAIISGDCKKISITVGGVTYWRQ